MYTPTQEDIMKYGQAARFGFDDPTKWVTVPSVPLLDEHEMTDDNGRPVATVDRQVLEVIARNNNNRVRDTGDPATLILGHTSDDPNAPEKPAKGFAVNYHVKPYRRDPQTGQVIYAIHGDFKVRPTNAHILEEYPRRSVELWWNKKELDPIALLGGTSPERDLSVVIRNSRLNHISLDTIPTDPRLRDAARRAEHVLQFSTRGAWTIESYNSPYHPIRFGKDKVGKVMGEFKRGELHSGSKDGPKVTSRKQALAIAMAETGKSNSTNGSNGMAKRGNKKKYEHECNTDDEAMKYAGDQFDPTALEDGDADNLNDFDPGSDMPDDEGMEPDSAETDPTVAKVFQSKQWKQLSQKLDMILAALEGPGTPGEGGMDDGGMGEEPSMDEMPPPAPPGAADGMGLPPEGMDDGGMGGMPEEESRLAHGDKPVQFMGGTGLPGPGNTFIPATGTTGKKYAKGTNGVHKPKSGSDPMNYRGQQQRRVPTNNGSEQILALQHQLQEFKLKFARSEAEKIISQLEAEGVIFGDTPQSAEQFKNEQADYLAYLALSSKEDMESEVEIMRTKYQRRKANPAHPTSVGVARYARSGGPGGLTGANGTTPSGEVDEENWAPTNPMEASDYADLITLKKYSRKDAISLIRKNRAKYAEYDNDVAYDHE